MGTSIARRGPPGKLWRLAKGAATRYLAPEGRVPAAAAQEVVVRYVSALMPPESQEERQRLETWRLTRKVAQDLGAFSHQALSRGWEAALRGWGLEDLLGHPPETVAQGLAAAWVGARGGLEAAVARASLVTVLLEALPAGVGKDPGTFLATGLPLLEPTRSVCRFLSLAFYQRLVLDLGEALEAAAGDGNRLQAGMANLRELIDQAGEKAAATHQEPELWHGLAGWLWVTQVINNLLTQVSGPERLAPGTRRNL